MRMKKTKQTCNTCRKITEPEQLYTHAIQQYISDKPVFEWYECSKCFRAANTAYFKVCRDNGN
jgi:hypothetical protein